MKLSQYISFVLLFLLIAPPLLGAESELSEIKVFAITGENASEKTNAIHLPIPATSADCQSGVSDCVDHANANAGKGKQTAIDRAAGAGNAANENAGNNRNGNSESDRNGSAGGDRGGSSDRGGAGRR